MVESGKPFRIHPHIAGAMVLAGFVAGFAFGYREGHSRSRMEPSPFMVTRGEGEWLDVWIEGELIAEYQPSDQPYYDILKSHAERR